MSSYGIRGIAERTGYRRRVSRNQAFKYGIQARISGVAKVEFQTTESTPVEEFSVSQDFWPTCKEPIELC